MDLGKFKKNGEYGDEDALADWLADDGQDTPDKQQPTSQNKLKLDPYKLDLRNNSSFPGSSTSDPEDTVYEAVEPVGSLMREKGLIDAGGESGVVGVMRKSSKRRNSPDGFFAAMPATPELAQPKAIDNRKESAKPAAPRRLADKKPKAVQHSGTPVAVSINIHMPEFRIPKIKLPKVHIEPKWFIMGGIVVVALLGGKYMQSKLALSNHKATPKAPVVASAELGYKPLQPPESEDANTQPTSASPTPKPKYDEKRGIYTFYDDYKGAKITVDQQAVPEKLRGNDAEIKKLQESLHTTDSFTTTLGKVYIYSSDTSSAQRMFLVNDKMLMFIQTTTSLSNSDWVAYIESLE